MNRKYKELDDHEIIVISEQSGVEPSIVRSWHKEFLIVCPTGRLASIYFLSLFVYTRILG